MPQKIVFTMFDDFDTNMCFRELAEYLFSFIIQILLPAFGLR